MTKFGRSPQETHQLVTGRDTLPPLTGMWVDADASTRRNDRGRSPARNACSIVALVRQIAAEQLVTTIAGHDDFVVAPDFARQCPNRQCRRVCERIVRVVQPAKGNQSHLSLESVARRSSIPSFRATKAAFDSPTESGLSEVETVSVLDLSCVERRPLQ